MPGADGKGLTCATLVMALFEELAIPLFKTEDWPSEPEDDAWKLWIIGKFREQGVMSEDHLKAMEDNFQWARFRPMDVAVASTKKKRPLDQQQTRALHPVLLRKIKNLSETSVQDGADSNDPQGDEPEDS